MTRPTLISLLAIPAVLLLGGCAAAGGDPAPSATADADFAAAEQYCVDSGGTIESRQPTFGTNNAESTWVELGEPIDVCRFVDDSGDYRTSIFVDPVTLHSENPTLAALAYLRKAPVPNVAPANPASQLCIDLGGAVTYGQGPDGGGFVLKGDDLDVVAMCVFADGSFIDEWGIGYYSSDTVRGADLAPLFRFDAEKAPAIFGH